MWLGDCILLLLPDSTPSCCSQDRVWQQQQNALAKKPHGPALTALRGLLTSTQPHAILSSMPRDGRSYLDMLDGRDAGEEDADGDMTVASLERGLLPPELLLDV